MSLKLKDIIANLESRGRMEEADFYGLVVPFELELKHGLSKRRVLDMTIDEIETWYRIPTKPEKYRGWNFWWGKEIEDASDD